VSLDVGHGERSLELAVELVDRVDPATRGLWPRAAALLGRQALEDAISWIWLVHAPGMEHCSMRAQLLCLDPYLGDERLAEEAGFVYERLSWACHHHAYDLAPTAMELRGWLDAVERILRAARNISVSPSGTEGV
jgi:hypothetical protein